MIVFIANQFIGDQISTGGDVLFLEMLKRMSGERTVIAPGYIHAAIFSKVSPINIVDSDWGKLGKSGKSASTLLGGLSTILRYLQRSVSTYRWLRNNADGSTVIYLTGDFICNILPVWLLVLRGVKVKVCANFFHRNPLPHLRPGNSYLVSAVSRLLQGISLKIIRNVAQVVFVLSEIGKIELLKEGFSADRVVLSGAGVESDISKYRITQRHRSRFVYIGRLNVTKGVFDLINILALLNRSNSEFECCFIGQGSDSDIRHLLSLAEQKGIRDKIEIKGYVSEDEKLMLLSSSCALAFPSKEEGYGIAVHEALYLGVPVVCYDLPVLKSIFSRSNSIHFAPLNNQQEFAKRMEDILNRSTFLEYRGVDEMSALRNWDDVYAIQSRYFS